MSVHPFNYGSWHGLSQGTTGRLDAADHTHWRRTNVVVEWGAVKGWLEGVSGNYRRVTGRMYGLFCESL